MYSWKVLITRTYMKTTRRIIVFQCLYNDFRVICCRLHLCMLFYNYICTCGWQLAPLLTPKHQPTCSSRWAAVINHVEQKIRNTFLTQFGLSNLNQNHLLNCLLWFKDHSIFTACAYTSSCLCLHWCLTHEKYCIENLPVENIPIADCHAYVMWGEILECCVCITYA